MSYEIRLHAKWTSSKDKNQGTDKGLSSFCKLSFLQILGDC